MEIFRAALLNLLIVVAKGRRVVPASMDTAVVRKKFAWPSSVSNSFTHLAATQCFPTSVVARAHGAAANAYHKRRLSVAAARYTRLC